MNYTQCSCHFDDPLEDKRSFYYHVIHRIHTLFSSGFSYFFFCFYFMPKKIIDVQFILSSHTNKTTHIRTSIWHTRIRTEGKSLSNTFHQCILRDVYICWSQLKCFYISWVFHFIKCISFQKRKITRSTAKEKEAIWWNFK